MSSTSTPVHLISSGVTYSLNNSEIQTQPVADNRIQNVVSESMGVNNQPPQTRSLSAEGATHRGSRQKLKPLDIPPSPVVKVLPEDPKNFDIAESHQRSGESVERNSTSPQQDPTTEPVVALSSSNESTDRSNSNQSRSEKETPLSKKDLDRRFELAARREHKTGHKKKAAILQFDPSPTLSKSLGDSAEKLSLEFSPERNFSLTNSSRESFKNEGSPFEFNSSRGSSEGVETERKKPRRRVSKQKPASVQPAFSPLTSAASNSSESRDRSSSTNERSQEGIDQSNRRHSLKIIIPEEEVISPRSPLQKFETSSPLHQNEEANESKGVDKRKLKQFGESSKEMLAKIKRLRKNAPIDFRAMTRK